MIDSVINMFKLVFHNKGYVFFDNNKAFNLNIVGVRSKFREANKFDDTLFVIYRDLGLRWCIRAYPITTDAGTYWLKTPPRESGTALLREGQYRGAYELGLHQGKSKALVQRKKVKVYRDNNKDNILDYNEATIEEGFFGINIHRSNPTTSSIQVDKWSAGCQVFANVNDFKDFLALCGEGEKKFGNSFTYTLINTNDLL